MQLYYMKKDGLPIGHSALALLTEFLSFQVVTIMMAVIGLIVNYSFIEKSIGNIKYLFILGIAINLVILIIIILAIFCKNITYFLLNFTCKILSKIHYPKIKTFRKKAIKQIKEYRKGARLLRNNKKVLLKIVTTTIFQVILYNSIPYLIYLSFGLPNGNFFEVLSAQAVLYISVSALPSPGAVGLSEGGFLIIYKLLFPSTLLSSAMILSRGISFYLFVIISGIAVLIFSLKSYLKKVL